MADQCAMVVWLDCTKLGRVSAKDLDQHMEILQRALGRRGAHSIGVVTAPVYTSERVGNALRAEAWCLRQKFWLCQSPLPTSLSPLTEHVCFLPKVRRFEDKMDMKGLNNYGITVRMDSRPHSKKVPLVFAAWPCMAGDGAVARRKQLLQRLPAFVGQAGGRGLPKGMTCNLSNFNHAWGWLNLVGCDRTPAALIPFLPESKYVVPSEADGLPHTQEGNRPSMLCSCEKSTV